MGTMISTKMIASVAFLAVSACAASKPASDPLRSRTPSGLYVDMGDGENEDQHKIQMTDDVKAFMRIAGRTDLSWAERFGNCQVGPYGLDVRVGGQSGYKLCRFLEYQDNFWGPDGRHIHTKSTKETTRLAAQVRAQEFGEEHRYYVYKKYSFQM